MRPSPITFRMLVAMERTGYGLSMRPYYGEPWWGAEYRYVGSPLIDVRPGRQHVQQALREGWVWMTHRGETSRDPCMYQITPDGEALLAGLRVEEFKPRTSDMTERGVLDVLRRHHLETHGWVYVEHFYIKYREVDAYTLGLWHSTNFRAIAYEVKVSRSDFRREVNHPPKRQVALTHSHQYYFVVPRGLVHFSEVPEECGFKEVDSAGRLYTVLDAPFRPTPNPTWSFVATLARKVYWDTKKEE